MLAAACLFKTRERLSVQTVTHSSEWPSAVSSFPEGRRDNFSEEWGVMRSRCPELWLQRVCSQKTRAHECTRKRKHTQAMRKRCVLVVSPHTAQTVSRWRLHVYLSHSVVCLTLALPWTAKYYCSTLKKDLCWMCDCLSDDEAEDKYSDCSKSLSLGLFYIDSAQGLAFRQCCAKSEDLRGLFFCLDVGLKALYGKKIM